MANVLWPKGREGFLTGLIDWDTDDIRFVLIRSSYTYNSTHQFISSITAGNENGRSPALGSKTGTDGTADAADITTGLTATAAAATNAGGVFKHTGVDATANLICYIDTATGLPFTPAAGGPVNVTWDNGGNRIFTL